MAGGGRKFMFSSIKRRIAGSPFILQAVEDGADLAVFREKPGFRVYFGIFLIAFSYLIGWPAVALFGILAVYFENPLIAVIGGPSIYITSHLVFWVGMFFAGSRYAMAVFRWGVRRLFEKTVRKYRK
jgi:hypothetical protein